jgi:hypothetical protein
VRTVSLGWPLSAMTQRPSGSLTTPVGPSSPEASSRGRAGWLWRARSGRGIGADSGDQAQLPPATLARGAAVVHHRQAVGGEHQCDWVWQERDQLGMIWPGRVAAPGARETTAAGGPSNGTPP